MLVPKLDHGDVVRVILAFAELYTQRRPDRLLFQDYATFTLLFQALHVDAVGPKTALPLLRAYHRMGVRHEAFVRAVDGRIVSGAIELGEQQLAEVVRLHTQIRLKVPELLEFVGEVADAKFHFFSEDDIGDLCRAHCTLRYHGTALFEVLRRELPFRVHEYAWWNLIDIAEAYLELGVDDREMIERFGHECFKLIFSMKYEYPAKALKVLAFLEAGDKRTFRSLIRHLPRRLYSLPPLLTAESVIACVSVGVEPGEVYHRLRGERLFRILAHHLTPRVEALPAKVICDVTAALAKVERREAELFAAIETLVLKRPFKFHAEHLVSLLRDFAALHHSGGAGLRALLGQRCTELHECTPSALCLVPSVLASHRGGDETAIMAEVSTLLLQPGEYALPKDPRPFRAKDDLWWQRLRLRNYRTRRRGAATAAVALPERGSGGTGAVVGRFGDDLTLQAEGPVLDTALAHVNSAECVELLNGLARLGWRDEGLLGGVTGWLCYSGRHVELSGDQAVHVVSAFVALDHMTPLLQAALGHVLLRVAPELPAGRCLEVLNGALALGLGFRSAGVLSLFRRCTATADQLTVTDAAAARQASTTAQSKAEAALLAGGEDDPGATARCPLDVQLFCQVMARRFGDSGEKEGAAGTLGSSVVTWTVPPHHLPSHAAISPA